MLGFRVCFWMFPLKPYSASTENSTFFWPLFSAALAWANDIVSLPSPLPGPSPNFAHFCTLPEDEFLNRVFTLTRPCLRSCKVFLCLESAAGAGALPSSAHTVGPRACTPAPPRPCSLAWPLPQHRAASSSLPPPPLPAHCRSPFRTRLTRSSCPGPRSTSSEGRTAQRCVGPQPLQAGAGLPRLCHVCSCQLLPKEPEAAPQRKHMGTR